MHANLSTGSSKCLLRGCEGVREEEGGGVLGEDVRRLRRGVHDRQAEKVEEPEAWRSKGTKMEWDEDTQ
jgi:hypothetical protein